VLKSFKEANLYKILYNPEFLKINISWCTLKNLSYYSSGKELAAAKQSPPM